MACDLIPYSLPTQFSVHSYTSMALIYKKVLQTMYFSQNTYIPIDNTNV